jgi:hypothetical protein
MSKTRSALTLLALLTVSACGSNRPVEETAPAASTAAPAPAAAAAPEAATVMYGHGFFDPEKDSSGQTWRWMSKEGTVVVANPRSTARLRLAFGVPVDNATIRVDLNGQKVDEFTVQRGDFRKDYPVGIGQQAPYAASDVRITTSAAATFPNDPRQLGLRVFDVSLSPQ